MNITTRNFLDEPKISNKDFLQNSSKKALKLKKQRLSNLIMNRRNKELERKKYLTENELNFTNDTNNSDKFLNLHSNEYDIKCLQNNSPSNLISPENLNFYESQTEKDKLLLLFTWLEKAFQNINENFSIDLNLMPCVDFIEINSQNNRNLNEINPKINFLENLANCQKFILEKISNFAFEYCDLEDKFNLDIIEILFDNQNINCLIILLFNSKDEKQMITLLKILEKITSVDYEKISNSFEKPVLNYLLESLLNNKNFKIKDKIFKIVCNILLFHDTKKEFADNEMLIKGLIDYVHNAPREKSHSVFMTVTEILNYIRIDSIISIEKSLEFFRCILEFLSYQFEKLQSSKKTKGNDKEKDFWRECLLESLLILSKLSRYDNIMIYYLKKHDFYQILINYLNFFKKEKYKEIKSHIFHIISNLYSLENQYLENIINKPILEIFMRDLRLHAKLSDGENIEVIRNIIFSIGNAFMSPINNINMVLDHSDICNFIFEKIVTTHDQINECKVNLISNCLENSSNMIKIKFLKKANLIFLFEMIKNLHERKNFNILNQCMITLIKIRQFMENSPISLLIFNDLVKRGSFVCILERLLLSNNESIALLAEELYKFK